MKKKISHLILVSILAMVTLVPMLPRTASATTTTADQINQQILVFNDAVSRAIVVLGAERVLFLVSASTGIPVEVLRLDAEALGLRLDTFIAVTIIQRSTGIPLWMILDRLEKNKTLGEIIVRINAPIELVLLRFTSMIEVFNLEIGVATGTTTVSVEQEIIDLTGVLADLNFRFNQFVQSTSFGTVRKLLLLTLEQETSAGFRALKQLLAAALQTRASLDTFASIVLFVNTMNAVTITGKLEVLGMIASSPIQLVRVAEGTDVPVELIMKRFQIFARTFSFSLNGA